MSENTKLADIGLIGLAVMGENLVLNMEDHGFRVCVFNRTTSKVDTFLKNRASGKNIIGTYSLEEFIRNLKTPRVIILMVMAGKPVDDFIEKILPLISKGDILIDAGNSDFTDTQRRCVKLGEVGIHFVGTGVSGGEFGARNGPSIMPGGSENAWKVIQPIFEAISAKVPEPCVTWIGSDGAGHFVKTVHNGIEYGDMQLICEAYHILKMVLGLSCDKMSKEWNKGQLESYLIEITSQILDYKENNEYLVEKIRDTAGQKGTGKWTVATGLELGVPITLIAEAVFARSLSSLKNDRQTCSSFYQSPLVHPIKDIEAIIKDLEKALYAAKVVSYTQGFMLLREASNKFHWNLDYGKIAMIWRGGCIIRSRFLNNIHQAYQNNPSLISLILDPYFQSELTRCIDSWRKIVSLSVLHGVPVPAFSSALSFFDGYRSAHLPANLLQAQRDFFGAHTFELDSKPGDFIHSTWGQES